jgi:aspartyl-tRNA(Asn)/glutamyl-tRNA(Gln) amidotransferase subunit B
MEEDPASLVYPGTMSNSAFVLIDYNRSGNPLVEVVTEPDMASPDEAREFMKKLITILSYLQIFDVDSGIIKADANVSIKESGYIRAEIKNITGFKEIERALNYEVTRQKKEAKEGKKLVQETRAWDPDLGITRSLRTKETEADYGYIIDPDLVSIDITESWLKDIKSKMPELSHQKVKRFIEQHKISKLDAEVIAADRLLAELYEKVAEEVDPILAAKWLRRELVRVLNYNKKEIKDLVIDEKHLIELLTLVDSKKITETTAQRIMEKLIESPFDVKEYVKKENLKVVADTSVLETYCKEAIANNPKAVEEYKQGNEKSLNFLIGQVMKKTKGTASPKEVNDLMKKLVG